MTTRIITGKTFADVERSMNEFFDSFKENELNIISNEITFDKKEKKFVSFLIYEQNENNIILG